MIKISQDQNNYVTVEIFNAGLNDIRNEIKASNAELKSEFRTEINELRGAIRDNARDISHLQTSLYWGFAIMAIVVTFIGFMMTLAPVWLEYFRERRKERDEERIQKMIDASIEKYLRERN